MDSVNLWMSVLVLVAFGLFAPYFILKLLFKGAHKIHPEERGTIELKDLTKDQQQVIKKR